MEAASRLVNTLLPLTYALTLTAYAADFFREDAFARRAARRLMELTLLLHAAHLALRTALYDHVPLAAPAEMATTIAFAVSLVYLVVVLLSVRRGPPLGWDESVYALRAGDFADGVAPLGYWDDYRAPGLPWLGHLWWIEGREAVMLRLLVAGFGLGLVGVTWLLTRHLFGRRAGLVAAAGVAVTPPLLLAATQVWPDVPGAAVGLLAIVVRPPPRAPWWIVSVVLVAVGHHLRSALCRWRSGW
jgi:hypothetical protein